MKIALNTARIIVGVLFIFSGVVKADDPLGLSYKMQEFFEAWGWTFLNDFSLTLSILMIAFEIIAGVAVLLGWRMKLFSWLLLLLILFFTFLTSYVVFSGKIRTCGCFGDCIPLTPYQTFTKDLILTALIFFIFRNRNSIRPLFKPAVSVVLLLASAIFAFASQAYMLKHLPVVDCLGYKVGKNIPAQMKVPPGSVPDSTVITFVYKKNGQDVEFTSDKFPADFDDSLYHFVKRYDKLVRQGNAEPAIKDFALKTASGSDTTDAVINDAHYTVLFFIREINDKGPGLLDAYLWLNDNFRGRKKGALFVVTSQVADTRNILENKMIDPSGDILSCDYVAVKTACRSNAALYLIKGGTILGKWAYADFDKAKKAIEQVNGQ